MSNSLNDGVRVKLTQVGLEEYKKQSQKLNNFIESRNGTYRASEEPAIDADGYYRTQFWLLIQKYAHLCDVGMPLPFTDFEFVE